VTDDRGGFDLVVAGAGMAGLTAAGAVARRGGRVAVLEKAAEIGGSTVLSGGMVWTADDPERLIEECPRADSHLIRALCADRTRLFGWCDKLGVHVGQEVGVLGYGHGRHVDMVEYLDACRSAVVAAGGEVMTRSQVYALVVETGRVVGVDALSGGEELVVRGGSTLLAGGGFQADPELLAEHVHPNAPDMLLRSNRASSGDGLRAALAIGAATSIAMDGFYGHLISWPTDVWVPGVYTLLSQYHSDRCALVNVHGDLFRAPFSGDHYNTQWTVKQPEGRAVMIMDRRLHADQAPPTTVSVPIDKFEIAADHGAHTAVAATIEGLGEAIAAWGYAGEHLAAAVAAHNADFTGPGLPITEPPFYALEVRPAITFTHGGLRIDTDARVLAVDGTPIPGLLAAGADAGGVFDGGYGGGLSAAGVFGLRAADTVGPTRS
jgi:succinate dehydrogenase/fumarate reductase flavoprotein subunit